MTPLIYSGPACPYSSCREPLPASLRTTGRTVCPRCARPFEAAAFAPPQDVRHIPQVAEAGPGGAAACGLHPANATIGNCGRCGVFMCALCQLEDVADQPLCPACFDRLTADERLPRLRLSVRNHRGLAIASLAGGLLIWP